MANKRVGVTLDINADISQVRAAATQLQQLLSGSNLSSGVQKNINKLATGLTSALTELEAKASQPIKDGAGAKDLERAYKKVFDYFNRINLEVSNLSNLKGTDLEAIFPDVQKKIKDLDDYFKTFEKVQKKIESSADLKNNKRALERAEQSKTDSEKRIETIKANGYSEQSVIDEAAKGVKDLKGRWEELKTTHEKATEALKEYNDKLAESTKKSESAKEKRAYADELKKKYSIKEINGQLRADWRTKENRGKDEQGNSIAEQHTRDWQAAEQAAQDYETAAKEAAEAVPKLETDQAGIDKLAQDAEAARQAYVQAAEAKDKLISKKKYDSSIESETANIEKQEERIKDLTEKIKGYDDQLKTAFDNLKTDFQKLTGDESFKDLEYSEENLKKLSDAAAAFKTGEIEKAVKIFEELGITLDKAVPSTEKIRNGIDKVGDSLHQMSETEQEISHLTSRLKYFFSLAGGFQLMRRAIRSAVETTKELDAVMTQTAVVSDYSVGDMWKTLPEYSKYAKQLGSAIKDVYSAQTLYVQQGLDMDSAMDLGIETLKMARVAGIDAATATDTMTAALRGFKMELNEVSAVRINDVYSKLAQNSASNVQEISTAMSKVAALANSANMSFENTAGFLAKIIESTREGAETAGTALKTVIARFTEVKKLYDEGELTGTDEEGQEVDVNKISAALRTAGINMNDFFTGAKGLDEIFMELGSKWDSLTTVQQRYIATMAAGSRQQSRFLALMQDYSRTVELTNMAYNSAGSGQEQFEKTLDSLESKLNQLKAAWDTFTMGIANSDFIKGFIDTGTKILETLNKIIEAISGGNGAAKSILSLVTAFGAFKMGGALLKGGLGKVGTLIGLNVGQKAGNDFWKTFTTQIQKAPTGTKLDTGTNLLNAQLKSLFVTKTVGFNDIDVQGLHGQLTNFGTNDIIPDTSFANLNNTIKEFGVNSKEAQTALEGLKEEYVAAGGDAKQFDAALQQNSQTFTKTSANISTLSTSLLMVGGLFLMVGNYLESTGAVSKQAAGWIKGLGAAFIAFGAVLKITQVAVKTFAISTSASIAGIPIIGWIAAVISAVLALTAVLANAYRGETASERLERIADACEKAVDGAKEVQDAFDKAQSDIEKIKGKQDLFSDLIVGTKDWNTAVEDLNESIAELVAIYPGLADAVDYVNGHLMINFQSQAYKDWIKEQQYNVANAKTAERSNTTYEKHENLWGGDTSTNMYAGVGRTSSYRTGLDNKIGLHIGNRTLSGTVNNQGKVALGTPTGQWYWGSQHGGMHYEDYRPGTVGAALFGQGTALYTPDLKNRKWVYDNDKRKKVKEEYGIDDIESLFSELEGSLQGAINSGEIKDSSTLLTFLGRKYGSNSNEFKYLSSLFYDYNGNRQTLPIEKIIQYSQEVQDINNDKIANSLSLRDLNLRNSGLNLEYANTYLAYSGRAFIDQFYKYTDDFLDGFKNQIDDSGRTYLNSYKEATGKNSNDDVSNEEFREYMRYQLASKDVFTNEAFNKFNTSFMKLSPELRSSYEKLISNRIEELTIDELKNLSTDAFSGTDLLQYTQYDPDKIKESYQQLYEGIEKYQPNIEKLAITQSQAASLIDTVNGIIARGGKPEEFLNNLTQLEKNIPLERLEEAKDIIKGIDFGDTTSIRNGMNQLKELGANIDYNLTQSIIEASKAVSKFSLKSIEEQIGTLEKQKTISEKLENGETIFNKEEYDLLKNLPNFKTENWQQTGLDEFTYIGEETNSILTSIDAAVSSLLKESIEETNNSIQRGKEIEKSIKDNITVPTTYFDDDNIAHTKNMTLDDFFGNLINGDGTINKDFYANSYTLEKVAEAMGINISDTNFEDLTEDQQKSFVADYWNNNYGIGGSALESNIQKSLNLQAYSNILPYKYTNAQSVINDTELTQKEKSETLSTGVKKLGAGEEYMAQQDIATLSKNGKDFTDVVNALTINSAKAAKKFDNLTQSYKDNADALKKENKGTREYGLALGNLTKSVKTAFGNNDKITEDFVDKHLDLFENYANGVEGAEDDIRKAMMDEGIIEGTTDQLNQLQATINGIDGEQLSINGTADCSQAFSELAALYGSAEAAAAAMEALGYSVTWEPDGETTMIMPDGSTRSIPNYKAVVKDSAGNAVNRNKGGGGGGGGGKKEFKNDFDKYYNMVEDINELERLRNLLESDYNQLLASRAKSGKDIYDNLKKQLKLLQEQYDLQADLAEKRKQQIVDTMNSDDYKDLQEYAWWNEEDKTLEIDWDKINGIKDSELGDRIKEYVSKMEGFQGQYDEAIEALEEIESTVQEIKERGKEEYTSLEDRVRDALIKQIQDKIDDLTAVDQAISDANQRVLDSISETLEMQRQERDNAETEEGLADKEQRLAYLRQDSSNANAVEIARLEKELAEEREDYTDTLIDQKISELQKQNEKAAEQRQQQIDLMQESLDYQEKTGAFWDQVYEYINNGVDAIGNLIPGSDLVTLLSTAEGFAGLSEIGQMTWLEELEDTVAQAVGYLALSRQLEDIGVKEGTKITFANAEGQTLTGKVDKNGNVVVDNGDGTKTTYKDVYQSYDGTYHTMESEKDAKTESKPATSTQQQQQQGTDTSKVEYEYKRQPYNDSQHEVLRRKKGTSKWSHYSYENHSGNPCSRCGYKKTTGGGGCFVAGTQITVFGNILKNIEDIRVNDMVLAYNEETKVFDYKRVRAIEMFRNNTQILHIELSNHTILKVTPSHPILTTDGWKSGDIYEALCQHHVETTKISVGDVVIGQNGNSTIINIKEIYIESGINVFNLSVEDYHTYLAEGIVVHNVNNLKTVTKYATGGLADYTGPAWLDGSPSNPELVLSPQDTKNFIQLKDILADVKKNSGMFNGNGGDNYYDIDVHVDQMNSDYDVDRAIDRIKTRLYQDGAYRNVNTLSRLR